LSRFPAGTRDSRAWRSTEHSTVAKDLTEYLNRLRSSSLWRKHKDEIIEFAKPAPGEMICDVGCGLGETAIVIADILKGNGKVVGVDLSADFVSYANDIRKSASEQIQRCLSFEQADVYNLSQFRNEQFDLILVERVFQHLKDPQAALQSLIRVLKPGGRLVVTDTAWRTLLISSTNDPMCDKASKLVYCRSQNPDVAYQMPVLFGRMKLSAVKVHPFVWYCQKLEDFVIISLQRSMRLHTTDWPPAEVEKAMQWLEDIQEASDKKQFFASVTLFTTVGIKPQ